MARARKYSSGLAAAYPGLLVDAAVLAVLTAIFSLRYFHSNYIFQGDVFLNLYIRLYHDLFSIGWDPYAWGYLGWYPIYGGLFPLNIITHGLTSLAGDTPGAALVFTQLNAAVSLFCLGFFTYLLARSLNLSRTAAVLAAAAVSFTGFHVQAGLRELDLFYLHSFMFVPLVFIFLIKASREKSLRNALAAGLMVGLSLLGGGNAPMFLFLPAFSLAFLAVPRSEPFFKAFSRSFFYAVLAVVAGMIVGAAMTMPSLAYMKLSSRPLFVESEAIAAYEVGKDILTALYREWWGTGYYDHERDSFMGLPVMMLALFGLFFGRRAKSSGELLMVVTAAIALVGMYVFYMPGPIKALVNLYFTKLSIRFPFRFFMVFMFAAAFMAAAGLDALKERAGTRANILIVVIIAMASIIYILTGLSFQDDVAVPARRTSLVATMVVAALFSLALITLLLKDRPGFGKAARYAPQMTALLVFAFYFFAGADAPARDERSQGYPRFYPATVEESIKHYFHDPAIEWAEYIGGETKPLRIFDRGLELRKNVWAPLAKVDVAFEPYNDPASSGALTRYAEAIFDNGFKPFSPLVDLYNVKFLKYREFKDYKETASRVFVNDDAFDRFFVTHNAKYFPTEDALFSALRTATREELRENVFLVGDGNMSAPGAYDYEDVEITERTPARIKLKVQMRSPGWLASSELWFPAWRASVDKKPVDILKAYGAFRAVRLESGLHEIEFLFDDALSRRGKIISIAAVIICLIAICAPWRKERA